MAAALGAARAGRAPTRARAPANQNREADVLTICIPVSLKMPPWANRGSVPNSLAFRVHVRETQAIADTARTGLPSLQSARQAKALESIRPNPRLRAQGLRWRA